MQALGQCIAGDIWCNQEQSTLDLTKFKQGQNMFVFDMCADFGLTEKTRTCYRIKRQVITNNLDRHLSIKGGTLVSKIDFAHPTHINAPDQIIVAELPLPLVMPLTCPIVFLFHRLFVRTHTRSPY